MTLTEQWKKGELGKDKYWVKYRSGKIDIWELSDGIPIESRPEIIEVLALVPSYKEWQKLKEFADYSLHNRDELTRQINFWMDKHTQIEKENQQLKELLKEIRSLWKGTVCMPDSQEQVRDILTKIDNVIGEKK